MKNTFAVVIHVIEFDGFPFASLDAQTCQLVLVSIRKNIEKQTRVSVVIPSHRKALVTLPFLSDTISLRALEAFFTFAT